MKEFFKKLFCKHDIKFSYQQMVNGGNAKMIVHKCTKCGKEFVQFI